MSALPRTPTPSSATPTKDDLGQAHPARSRALLQGPLAEVVGYRIVQANLTTLDIFRRKVGDVLDLRPVEYSLLILLQTNGEATPKQLAAALALSAPNLTILLDRMQQRGLITRERNQRDRRSQLVALSEEGAALARRANERTTAMEAELDGVLTRAERSMLIELLTKVARSRRSE